MPALGFSLFLIAVGAIMAFAVNYSFGAVEIGTIGVILMVVGIVGLVMSMLFWTSWAPFARHPDDDVHMHTR